MTFTFSNKLCKALWVLTVLIDAYSLACYQNNGMNVLSLEKQNFIVYFERSCLGEILSCLMSQNVYCEATVTYSTNNRSVVNKMYSIPMFTTSTMPMSCVITKSNNNDVISCSRSYTPQNSNKTVLMLRENTLECFRSGFVPLNQWNILKNDYIIQTDYSGYLLGVCTDNVHHTTLHTVPHSDQTTDTTLISKVFNSVSTTDEPFIKPTENLSSNNISIFPSHDTDHGDKDEKTLIISLCVVLSVLIVIPVLIGLFRLHRKRSERMKLHKVEKRWDNDNIEMKNVTESSNRKGNVSSEDSNIDDTHYETYNGINISTRRQNDTIITDADGYLAPFRDQINKFAFQNSTYTEYNDKEFENPTYEDLDSINVQVYSGKPSSNLSDSVYDEYNSILKSSCPRANNAYQNAGTDQPMHSIDSSIPNNKEDNESVPTYEIHGIVLDEFIDIGESRDYEYLENIKLDASNSIIGEIKADEILSTDTETNNMYFILEEN